MGRVKQVAGKKSAGGQRKKPVRVQTRCGLDFPPARVRHELMKQMNGIRVSKKVDIALAAAVNVCMDVFLQDSLTRLSDKELAAAKRTVRASHCATALADPTTIYHGVFPTQVAGEYRKCV